MKKLVFSVCLCAASVAWGQTFKTLATDMSGDDYSSNMDVTEFATALSANQDSIYFKITHANSRSGDFGYFVALDTNSVTGDGQAINQANLYSGSPNNSLTYDLMVLVYENGFFPGVFMEVLDGNQMPTQIGFVIDTADDYSLSMKFALADIGGDEAMNIIAGVGSFDISSSGPSDIIPNTNYVELLNGTTLSVSEHSLAMDIYPNPAQDFIQINQRGSVDIFDVFGKKLCSKTVEKGESLSVAQLPAGYYFISINGYSVKLVKL